jgi:hypothetical protein
MISNTEESNRRPRLFVSWHPKHPHVPVYVFFKNPYTKHPTWALQPLGPRKIDDRVDVEGVLDDINNAYSWASGLRHIGNPSDLTSEKNLQSYQHKALYKIWRAQTRFEEEAKFMDQVQRDSRKVWREFDPMEGVDNTDQALTETRPRSEDACVQRSRSDVLTDS